MSRADSSLAESLQNDAIDLNRLLTCLEHTVLSDDADPFLQKSRYERTKVGANLDYARNLLLRLEHDRSTAKTTPQDTTQEANLKQKRTLIKRIQNRLYELNQLDDENDAGSSSEGSDTEDLLRRYAPAVNVVANGIDSFNDTHTSPLRPPSHSETLAAAAHLSSTLRSRSAAVEVSQDAVTSTSTSTDVLPRKLPTPGAPIYPFTPAPSTQEETSTNTKLLEQHTSEQEALTSSLLTVAQALKASTLSFADSLESSNPLVDKATQALDGNVQGMEAAGSRMNLLRRTSRGWGLFQRISLYARIGILAVVALVIVFVLPKLRF